MEKNPVLSIKNLTKRFPGVIANKDISLDIYNGEIVSIVGENGAGKSTFCKMLTGVYRPDEGSIFLNGKECVIHSPIESMQMGIGMVYQERNLVENLTVAENVCLGHEPVKGYLIDNERILAMAEEIRERLRISLDLSEIVSNLGAGAQQLVEIMRALYNNPKILILDEPTASLGEGEVEPFLEFVKQIKKELDLAVIFISHKLDEVYMISDKIAVFTDGQCVLHDTAVAITKDQCIRAMLRNHTMDELKVQEFDKNKAAKVLVVEEIQYGGKKQDISFTVHQGEIVGFYGLVGSGRTECAEVLYGLRRFDKCRFRLGDTLLNNKKLSTLDMIHEGLVLTPERRADGMFKQYSLVENIAMMFYEGRLANKFGIVKKTQAGQLAKEVLSDNNVKFKDAGQTISTLSGGNIQKIIIGRSLRIQNVRVLILDEPTVGMDIGAKHEVYEKTLSIAEKEKLGVIFISSELDELISICHRIYVFAEGNIVDEYERSAFDKEKILSAALHGSKRREAVC